ncbi:MAG TPA: AAA family ATPase [Thermoanaerobaculia bacterium]|nr:AAA family ATPase [Thermoanaerobaculia bacterium]
MNRYVVLSGLPASGKSTLARALSQAFSLPLLDKDQFLETLFDSKGVGDARWRRHLSQEADASFRQRAEQSAGAVLTSWWKHPQSTADSGTPTDWLDPLPGFKVEVHCRCSAQAAAARFLARKRHPGHLDDRWSYAELVANFDLQASLGPLGLGSLVEVSTEEQPDIPDLIRRVADVFAGACLG